MSYGVLCWVRVEKYCNNTGESIHTVHERIREGVWAASKHYKRTGPRTLWINQQEVDKWVSQLPHVEAAPPPASRSGSTRKAKACA